nr:helix-turn-helix transcriptional regulator [Ktedonobacteraceae bacterium]
MERRKRDEVQERPSKGVETTLNVIGGKWKLLILWHLAIDSRRYGQLRRLIPGITEKMLIQQLRELESDGIIGRNVFDEVPPRVEYFLTSHGRT